MRILINWDYDRIDLLAFFDKLKEKNELIFIFKYNPSESIVNIPYKVIYWNDFSSPYALLKEINPTKIIFHDIESFHQVSLNIAAKNSKIRTFVIEHGLRGDYEIDIALNNKINQNNTIHTPATNNTSNNTAKFYLKSFKLRNIFSLFSFLRFMSIRKKNGLTLGLYYCQFRLREADYYINFTLKNASYIIKRDGISHSKIKSIGNPHFDKLFASINQNKGTDFQKPFHLLLDSPLVEDSVFSVTKDQKRIFLEKLIAFCESKKTKLVVKLHPKTYNATYNPISENVDYITHNENLMELITHSEGCFMTHFSTLSPIAIYYKPCLLFNVEPKYNIELTDEKLIPVSDFYDFEIKNLNFNSITENIKEKMMKNYIFSLDGMATNRLTELVQNL